MSFKDLGWSARYAAMGDQAEAAFEADAKSRGLKYVRYGLCRPEIHVASLPTFIRYTPDYLTVPAFVEVQGFGRDQLFKLKVDKMEALRLWAKHHPVVLFAFDSTNNRMFTVGLGKLVRSAPFQPIGFFDGVKPYREWSADRLEELEHE